jgi:hypothetical protein
MIEEYFSFCFWRDGRQYSAKSWMAWRDAISLFDQSEIHCEILDRAGKIVKTKNERVSNWLRKSSC